MPNEKGGRAAPAAQVLMNRRTLSICAGCLALCCLLAAAPAPRPATIISEPKKAVVEALEDRALPELIPLGTFTVYAYCSCPLCCGQWSGGPTASGTMPEEGRTLAADWDVLPAGTEVYLEGIGWRTVEDTGSGIMGDKLDLYMDSHEAALAFGVRELEIWMR